MGDYPDPSGSTQLADQMRWWGLLRQERARAQKQRPGGELTLREQWQCCAAATRRYRAGEHA